MYLKKEKIMKKLLSLLFSCLIVFSFSTIAYSAEGMYISGNIGAAMLEDVDVNSSAAPGIIGKLDSGTGLSLGIAIGYDFGNNIRVDGELAHQKNDLDTASLLNYTGKAAGDFSSLAFLLNGYYDFKNETPFIFSIGAGVGLAKVEINDFSVPGYRIGSEDDTVFAYQVGAGVGYAVTEKFIIELKYRYFGTSDSDLGSLTAEYTSHNTSLGIRFNF